jgi:hypothetical protein
MNISYFRRPISIIKIKHYILILTDNYDKGLWLFELNTQYFEFIEFKDIKVIQPSVIANYRYNQILVYDTLLNKLMIFSENLRYLEDINLPEGKSISTVYYDEELNMILCCDINFKELIKISILKSGEMTVDILLVLDLQYAQYITKINIDTYLIVDSGKNRILEFNIKTYNIIYHLKYGREGKGKVRNPTCILFNNDYLYVFDNLNYLIQIFTKNFKYIHQFGQKGNDLDCFDLPHSGLISNNMLYICDRNNDSIKVYDIEKKNLNYLVKRKFRNAKLRRPVRAIIDSLDNIYIADRDNDCIQIFDKNNKFNTVFHKSKNGCKLLKPSSVGIIEDKINKYLIVASRGKKINKLLKININTLNSENINLNVSDPQDMAINNSGDILIADTDNRRIIKTNIFGEIKFKIKCTNVSNNDKILVKGISFGPDNTLLFADYDKCIIYIHCVITGYLKNTINLSHYKKDILNIKSIFAESNYIIICVRGAIPIWMISYDGVVKRKFGSKGRGNYKFRNPSNLTKMNCGDYLIVDKENDRIGRFNKNLEIKTYIG